MIQGSRLLCSIRLVGFGGKGWRFKTLSMFSVWNKGGGQVVLAFPALVQGPVMPT